MILEKDEDCTIRVGPAFQASLPELNASPWHSGKRQTLPVNAGVNAGVEVWEPHRVRDVEELAQYQQLLPLETTSSQGKNGPFGALTQAQARLEHLHQSEYNVERATETLATAEGLRSTAQHQFDNAAVRRFERGIEEHGAIFYRCSTVEYHSRT